MHMQVARDPRSSGAPLINPNIEPLRLKRTLRQIHRAINQFP